MQCQKCQTRPASVNLTLRMNQKTEQFHICDTCFSEIKQQSMNPQGFFGNMDGQFFDGFQAGGNKRQGQRVKTKSGQSGGGLLDQLGRNVTEAAKAGLIDPVIGREKEVKRVVETLNRRNKNNPVLIGEPGVGKTAIAEGLALKIVEGQVPNKLKNKTLYLLDVASLVANTGIRGQFEERMKQLIQELQERKDIIVFVDEIHLLVGAGTAEGSQMDAGNILKPALARGELQLIGATTLKEYRQIEKDAALERRLQPIIVNEPSNEEAIQILQGIKDRYEDYHHVRYSDEVVEQAVLLSKRYIQDRYLPDKAIDLIDEAGSRLNLVHSESDKSLIEDRLAEIAEEKQAAAEKEDYETAAHLRHQELKLEKQLEEVKDEEPSKEVSVEDIQLIIEEKTGIPVQKMQADEQSKMRDLGKQLASKVIGQDHAVEKVAKAIRRSRAGLKAADRPIGFYLFVGPTGVGKTELAKVLAEELFGTREALIRLDMSEYMEKHSVSKIIGSPPGYVGHEEAGQLTEKVRRKPYSLILLDEIEKAHPDVQHMFLQIMEDGHLTDSHGRKVSFKETVIIMTSNAGSGFKEVHVGFNKDQNEAVSTLETLKDYFKPEFLNRFDSIITFNPLTTEDLVKIVDLMLDDVIALVEMQDYQFTITDEVKQFLSENGYNPDFGAGPLRRVIRITVDDGITDLLLEDEEVTEIKVELIDGEIVVKNGN